MGIRCIFLLLRQSEEEVSYIPANNWQGGLTEPNTISSTASIAACLAFGTTAGDASEANSAVVVAAISTYVEGDSEGLCGCA